MLLHVNHRGQTFTALFTFCCGVMLFCFPLRLAGQTYQYGDYKCVQTGPFESPSTWNQYLNGSWQSPLQSPSAANGLAVYIPSGFTVTVNQSVTIRSLMLPGICASIESSALECCAPAPAPPPPWVRSTSGISTCPFQM